MATVLVALHTTVLVNPWRLVVLDSRWQLLTFELAAAALVLAFTSTRSGGWRGMLSCSMAALVIVAALSVPLACYAAGTLQSLSKQRIRLDDEHSLFIEDSQYGLGPDAACRQLELRTGRGLLARHRRIGACPQLKYSDHWTYGLTSGRLIIDTGDGRCIYELSAALGPITVVDDASCIELLGDLA